jgi:hypothetical protein
MMQPTKRKLDPQLAGFFVLLAFVSIFGALYCIAGLAEIQGISLQLSNADLVLYSAWFITATVSSLAILRCKKWGVYLLSITTLIVTIVNIAQGSATWGGASLGAIVVFALLLSIQPIWGTSD